MADVAGGYAFVSGEKNITHTKLNAAQDGTIQTSFHTGKSAVAANPSTSDTQVMVYDTAAATYKKGTLAALFFDHTGLVSTRTAKTIPITADLLLLSDSAAAFANKSMTVGNILFGAANHTAPVAGDIIPIYNSAGAVIGKITLANLINLMVAHTAPVAADEIMVRENGGAVRKMTLLNLVNGAVAETVPVAAHKVLITDGSTVKNITLATLISGIGTSLTSPAGTELVQVNDAGTLKKLLLSDLRAYANGIAYVKMADVKADTTAGGTFTSGAWQTRDINTEVHDTGAIASVAGNQITLPAGTYDYRIEAPAYAVQSHIAKLYNVTDAADVATGTSGHSGATTPSTTCSIVAGRVTIAGSKVFEVRHRCTSTKATDGYGVAVGIGASEVYTVAEFWKVA